MVGPVRSARDQLLTLWRHVPAHRRRWRYLGSVFFLVVSVVFVCFAEWWLLRALWVMVGAAHAGLLATFEHQPIIEDLLELTKDQNALITKQNDTLSKASATIASQAAFVEDAMAAITKRLPPKIQ